MKMKHFKISVPLLIGLFFCSFNGTEAVSHVDIKFIEFLNPILDKISHLLTFQKLANENGTKTEFRDYLLEDKSNDEIADWSPQDIIVRSGYRYENHYVTSRDRYTTELIRIINPLANPKRLKQPPVMLIHGGVLDQTVWIWASAIQHHPEKYPRTFEEDGPITSWNRSLAFVLANNGYDVWLVGVRGCNRKNQMHKKYRMNPEKYPMTYPMDSMHYWQFTIDDLVDHELPQQMDKVMEVTGSDKEYAEKVHSYVIMGPPINLKGFNNFGKLLMTTCANSNYVGGTLVFTEFLTSDTMRKIMIMINSIKKFRYSIVWGLSLLGVGPTPTFQTAFEPAVMGHLLQFTGLKMIKHFCQQVVAGKLQRYDHGPVKNIKVYGKIKPPSYDLSKMNIKHWALVYGDNDKAASWGSNEQLLKEIRHKPTIIHAPNFNHLDLVAGMKNGKYVNLPILKFLDSFHQSQF